MALWLLYLGLDSLYRMTKWSPILGRLDDAIASLTLEKRLVAFLGSNAAWAAGTGEWDEPAA